MIAID
ncbi:CPXV004 protein [Cowpox virus]